MFDKLLIANRGEIACRIIRTARRLGIATVAVYSAADADALHVELADEALAIGPAPAAESYLRGELLIEAARRSGAGAIHPGYGFLAENAPFAAACAAAGFTFVGPPPEAIRAMGDKSAAKALMARAGVPVLPGYHGADQAPERLAREAAQIGYPLLIKPSAGGGGKGMRVVADPETFTADLAAARREAQAAFGDERVLLERYLQRPRHVEIQIFADARGNVVHLFERDCSLQRRHQKIVEEAPAPGLGAELRRQMGEAATTAARSIGYRGAGTVEFLLAPDLSFYFMEMNTRLQVEHPVTELVTSQDLVEWQLRVAAGEALPCGQAELSLSGHAMEVRLYAEDPLRDFLPATGTLCCWHPPEQNGQLRLDTGVRQGDAVTPYYDPLLAKLIAWGEDRETARRRLLRALSVWQVGGVTTNVELLAALVAHPDFAAGRVHTAFVEEQRGELLPEPSAPPAAALALAGLELLLQRQAEAAQAAAASADSWSPWHRTDGWRLNGHLVHRLHLRAGSEEWPLVVHFRPEGYRFELPGGTLAARGGRLADGRLWLELDGGRLHGGVLRQGTELTVMYAGRRYRLHLQDPAAEAAEEEGASGALTAPMPGRVLAVMVASGERVRRGAPLMVLEAMKMEHTVTAPCDGLVTRLHFQVGALVSEGDSLLALEAEKG